MVGIGHGVDAQRLHNLAVVWQQASSLGFI